MNELLLIAAACSYIVPDKDPVDFQLCTILVSAGDLSRLRYEVEVGKLFFSTDHEPRSPEDKLLPPTEIIRELIYTEPCMPVRPLCT